MGAGRARCEHHSKFTLFDGSPSVSSVEVCAGRSRKSARGAAKEVCTGCSKVEEVCTGCSKPSLRRAQHLRLPSHPLWEPARPRPRRSARVAHVRDKGSLPSATRRNSHAERGASIAVRRCRRHKPVHCTAKALPKAATPRQRQQKLCAGAQRVQCEGDLSVAHAPKAQRIAVRRCGRHKPVLSARPRGSNQRQRSPDREIWEASMWRDVS